MRCHAFDLVNRIVAAQSRPMGPALKVRDWIRDCQEARAQGRPVIGYHDFMQTEKPLCQRCGGAGRVKKPDGAGSMNCPSCRPTQEPGR